MNLVALKNRMVEIEMQAQMEKEKATADAYRIAHPNEQPKLTRQMSKVGRNKTNKSVLSRNRSKAEIMSLGSGSVDIQDVANGVAGALNVSPLSAIPSESPSIATTPFFGSTLGTPRDQGEHGDDSEAKVAAEMVSKYSVYLKDPYKVSIYIYIYIYITYLYIYTHIHNISTTYILIYTHLTPYPYPYL